MGLFMNKLYPFPLHTIGSVLDFNPHCLELVPDGVGLAPVLGLFGLGALGDEGLDFLRALHRSLRLLPKCRRLLQQVQAEYLVIAVNDRQLGAAVPIRFQHVVQGGDTQRGI